MTPRTDPPDLSRERALWECGFPLVAGFDEAGRGALAGPVAVGAVVLPADEARLAPLVAGCRDSKQLTPLQREACARAVRQIATAWSVAFASAQEIDGLGIVRATRLACERALAGLATPPQYLLMDYRLELPECALPQSAFVHGDALCLSIAAASVLAKTVRDARMGELGARFPGYTWERNKGYGTLSHRAAMVRLGRSPEHRRSFTLKQPLPRGE